MSSKELTPTSGSRTYSSSEGATALPVMDVPGTDISKFMALQGTPRRQSLQGFDEDYVDIVDYIVRVIHRIWEEKGIGLIYDTYNTDVLIHTSEGHNYGRDKVVADSMKNMAAFPDCKVIAADVIWSGNDVDGFHSSHRIAWFGTNTGWSNYGPPTNRRATRMGGGPLPGQRKPYRRGMDCQGRNERNLATRPQPSRTGQEKRGSRGGGRAEAARSPELW